MIKRWIIYAASLLGCIVFYVAHGQWLSWLLLCMVAGIPILSLLLCLLQACFLHPQLRTPTEMQLGCPQKMETLFRKEPLLFWNCYVSATNTLTGQRYLIDDGEYFPAAHCGRLHCSTKGLYVTDYLGLFRLRLLSPRQWEVLVRPVPVPMGFSNEAERLRAQSWRPKPGGGYSEQHDLRLYRPGDSLNQIHWKLSAKTGKVIIREAMIPCHGRVLVTLNLSGSPKQLDRKMGNLLWLGNRLLRMDMAFEILARTGSGTEHWTVADKKQLYAAIDALLSSTTTTDDTPLEETASWHYHIGGDGDEV